MAIQSPYKKYNRGQRQASVETSFKNGMMFTEGTVLDGYVKTLVNFDFTQDSKDALKPRAALVTSEVIVPDMNYTYAEGEKDKFLHSDTTIKASKECVEDGVEYRQFIFGKPDMNSQAPQNTGDIWVGTSRRSIDDFEDVITAPYSFNGSSDCAFYNTSLTEIHDVKLVPDAKTSVPVGAFMGNSFYFFSTPGQGILRKTEFDTSLNPSRYTFKDVDVKELTASEAVNYGYNMLSENPYEFEDKTVEETFQMEGILPYDSKFETGSDPKLMMSPKANTRVWFRCNYNAKYVYKIVWSWKEVSGTDDWTIFHTEDSFIASNTPVLQADLIVPAKEIMVRCEAYYISGASGGGHDTQVVERAMTIGFDFSLDPESTTRNSQQETYDLSTATGMMGWRNRLVVWGVPEDPTILFISDLDEPGYFPYPNNITIFDAPIIAVTELMDTLVVFTHSKVYQVSQNEDGTSWTSTVIQSHLYIESWDKHLIQPVRNMVYFKSGNYYYMLVPKAQSTTGELTLAPITTPITDFFNHFQVNVERIFKDCFKDLDDEGNIIQFVPEDLITYYNFIDYESVHNFYVYRFNELYVHFDIIYNVVDRYWKINIYESAHYLYPFRNDATQTGLMAGTSVQPIKIISDEVLEEDSDQGRIVQLFKFDPLNINDLYILSDIKLVYDPAHFTVTVSDGVLILPGGVANYVQEFEQLIVNPEYVRVNLLDYEWFYLIGDEGFVNGFNRVTLRDLIYIYASEHLKDVTVFPNKQMLDTGYRDANPFINKRYRELQLQINNPDNQDMEFGMDFQIAGEPRNTDFLYEVSQTIDELHQDEGILYLDATPYMPVPWDDGEQRRGEMDKINQWILEHQSLEDVIRVSLWKVRASISGKGVAPRLRLFTRGTFNYQLLGINWIYREMNMR